jgi:hypothetical protein
LRERRGNDNPFAGREPVGLDDDRRALRRDIGFRGRRIGEPAIDGGRNALARTKVLHKPF